MASSLQCFDAEPSQSAGRWKHIKTELGPKSKARLPAAGLQPFAHFAEAVVAPEGFAVDDEEWRAEHALVHGLLGRLPQLFLDRRVLHAGEDGGAVVAEADRHIHGRFRLRRRSSVCERRVIDGARIGFRVFGRAAVEPVEYPTGIDRGERKALRQRELDAELARAAGHVTRGIRTTQ